MTGLRLLVCGPARGLCLEQGHVVVTTRGRRVHNCLDNHVGQTKSLSVNFNRGLRQSLVLSDTS